jgi:hypothetical protein
VAPAVAKADLAAAKGADAGLDGGGGGLAGLLGDEIDHAAGEAGGAVEEAGGAFEDADLLDAEEVGVVAAAGDAAGETVDAPVVGGHAVAAGVEVVTLLDGAVGVEAGNPEEEVAAGLDVLLPEARGIEDGDGAGGVEDGDRELEGGGVGGVGAGADDFEAVEGDEVGAGVGCGSGGEE